MIPNESEKVFRDRFIELDGSKNNKEFDTKLPGYLDLFVEYSVFAQALELFKAGEDELAELNQHALRQIRAKNNSAENICRANGIALPAYRADLPLDDDMPLVMRLDFALLKIFLIMEREGLSLGEEADNNAVEPNFYDLWLKKWHELNGFIVYNLLLLHRDNRYKSLLKRYMLPSTNILEEPCGLKALMRLSLPAPNEQDRFDKRKSTAYRLYFYALPLLHDRSRNSMSEELPIISAIPTTRVPAKKDPVFDAVITEDAITYSNLKNTEANSIMFERKSRSGHTSKRADVLLDLLHAKSGISKTQLQAKLGFSPQQLSDLLCGINKRFSDEWRWCKQYIPTGSDIRKVKINDGYPTTVTRE